MSVGEATHLLPHNTILKELFGCALSLFPAILVVDMLKHLFTH
jgi:hypothetical protein